MQRVLDVTLAASFPAGSTLTVNGIKREGADFSDPQGEGLELATLLWDMLPGITVIGMYREIARRMADNVILIG